MAKQRPNNAAKIKAIALRIAAQVNKQAGKGLQACAVFLTARVKEEISVPAPRKRATDRSGNFYYRATTKAIPGAPIRKLSGRARQTTTWMMLTPTRAVVGVNARSNKGYNYPKRHELKTGHAFLRPTAMKYKRQLNKIMGRSLNIR